MVAAAGGSQGEAGAGADRAHSDAASPGVIAIAAALPLLGVEVDEIIGENGRGSVRWREARSQPSPAWTTLRYRSVLQSRPRWYRRP